MKLDLLSWWFDRSQNVGRQFIQLWYWSSGIQARRRHPFFIGTGPDRDRGNIRDGSDSLL